MVSDNLPCIIPQPRKTVPDLESLQRVGILGNQHFLLSPYCWTFTLSHLRSFDDAKS